MAGLYDGDAKAEGIAELGGPGLEWKCGRDVNEHGHRVVDLDADELDTVHRIHDLCAEGLS